MNKYQREFISMDGEVFYADVYRVLKAFEVTCPAVQHAVKKLLMPGQRGAKDKRQDLNEALMSVLEALSMECVRLPEDSTLTDEAEPEAGTEAETEAKPEPQPKPKLVTWRKCVPVLECRWVESGKIPAGWAALEAHTQPIETIQQLPEGQEP